MRAICDHGAPASVHVGSAGTFYAVTILQPTRDLGVAVFVNAGGERGTKARCQAHSGKKHPSLQTPGG